MLEVNLSAGTYPLSCRNVTDPMVRLTIVLCGNEGLYKSA